MDYDYYTTPLSSYTMDSFDLPTKLTNLPQATVQKIINEVLTSRAGGDNTQAMSFAKETRDLLIECCVEFITMITTEANDMAEKDAKKTIACEHITKALQELGFGEYVLEIERVAGEFRMGQVVSIRLPERSWALCVLDFWANELRRHARRSSRRSSRAVCLPKSLLVCRMSSLDRRARSTMLVDRARDVYTKASNRVKSI